MSAVIGRLRSPSETPLLSNGSVWSRALSLARDSLLMAAGGLADPAPAAISIAVAAARARWGEADALLALLRRALVRSDPRGEIAVRSLRALARLGEPVDLRRLPELISSGTGRVPRIALAALAEAASHGQTGTITVVIEAINGPLKSDAAHFLACLCTEEALDALSRRLRSPGIIGIHAAAALLAVEDDPFAFEVLCERLCETDGAVVAARALWEASPDGRCLLAAETTLARWARRGVAHAARGRHVAAALLTAAGLAADLASTSVALGDDDDELVLVGVQAAYWLGNAEQARATLAELLRRGPAVAVHAFQVLTRWADVGDAPAMALHRALVDRRPVDLSRAAMFEVLAEAARPALCDGVARALASRDRLVALDAARAVAKLHEPPSIIPPAWL